jgi:dihydroneopterin aldolase
MAGLANAQARLRHVFLRDMILPARIGVYPREHAHAQRVRINIDLAVREMTAPPQVHPLSVAEELARVVDYERLANRVRAIVSAGHVRLVETLAETLARACLDDDRVQLARVRVEKLDVFSDATSAGVEIERRREDLSTT